MTRSTPADIITYLDALTDPTGITITYVNLFENEQIKAANSVGINWGAVNWVEEARIEDTETNQFVAQIVADTLDHANTILDHVRDNMKVKTLAGGHYHCPVANPMKQGNYYVFFLDIEEVMFAQ